MQSFALPPGLEQRFAPPRNWRFHNFKNTEGRRLRFGSAYPESRTPSAVVVILPGRSEFIEKYFETVHDLLQRNLSVWIMDWQGQGGSERIGQHRQHPRSVPFDRHVEDLKEFILGYVKHAAVYTDVGRIPMVMLAQSMGGNIGLRFLHKYPGIFECAALSPPMLGIKAFEHWPAAAATLLSATLGTLCPERYAFGQSDWDPADRIQGGANFSSDSVRSKLHDAWMKENPDARVGGATFSWVRDAFNSCGFLARREILEAIKTPCLVAIAGRETLVSNPAIKRAVLALPHAKLLEIPESGHEMLMETDAVRDRFLDEFHAIVQQHIIARPEALKPF